MTHPLLIQRWLLKAPAYPHCPFEGDTILIANHDGELYSHEQGYPWSKYKITIEDAEKYPNLFVKLPWWQDRDIEEMPEYISYYGSVLYVDNWLAEMEHDDFSTHISGYVPATLEEFIAYKNKQNG